MESKVESGKILLTDADNTLWDINRIYREAHLKLLQSLERLAGVQAGAVDRLEFVREVDRGLVSAMGGRWKYAPSILANAVHMRLQGLPISDAIARASSKRRAFPGSKPLVEEYAQKLSAEMPHLRKGVREGLVQLHDSGIPIFVATEGSIAASTKLLEFHNILQFVNDVLYIKDKTKLGWVTTLRKFATRASNPICVGDQISRDLKPAAKAGYLTVHFPSDYRTHSEASRDSWAADHTIQSYSELPSIFAR